MNTTLKRLLTICTITGILASCGKKPENNTPLDSTAVPSDTAIATTDTVATSTPYVFFNIDSLRNVLNAEKHHIDQILSDPSTTKGYIGTLSGRNPASIPYAIHYIKHHPAPDGSSTYDTLYKQFKSLYYLVAVAYSGVVGGQTWSAVLEKPEDDPARKNLVEYLKLYSLTPFTQEGVYYVDADPGLYTEVFHRKASASLSYFLHLQQKDLSEGFFSDGGLTISFDQLYKRIEAWGLFIAANPNFFMTRDAIGNYRAYLSALIIGDDNSPVFDQQTQTLIPEVKALYETIIATGKDPVSKKIITDYYNLMAKDNFKQPAGTHLFLDKYDLPSLFSKPV